jgi:hypothetical protein
MPAFEELISNKQQEKIVQNLLFDLMTFHAHAKLRIHTDKTILSFRLATSSLGFSLRQFHTKTCAFYADTKELPREKAARLRRAANKAKNNNSSDQSSSSGSSQIQGKKFSMATYKTHSLSHYPDHVEKFGSYDSVSTRDVSIMSNCFSKQQHVNFWVLGGT